jgi:5-(carboxyamino)imidazole ribonucleotide synthase
VSAADRPILPGATVGVLGNGQLGRMLALAAGAMGYRTATLGPDSVASPTGLVSSTQFDAGYDDLEAIEQFAREVDVVTFEFENVTTEAAQTAARFAPVRPSGAVLHTTQNRLREKTFLRSIGCATADFAPVCSSEDVPKAVAAVGLPAVLKTAGSGYDGKGQRVVGSTNGVAFAWDELGCVDCVLEGFVTFAWEGSVVAARGVDGSYADYGLVRNEHAHHILDVTTAPAPNVPPALAAEASEIARRILHHLDVVGVLCVELFVTYDGQLLVNELAPRPHNSGHWTIEGAETSQFEQQLRAVCGLPLGSTAMRAPGAAMANLLGDLWENGEPDWSAALALPGVHLHLYGKAEARPGRKMGHLTALADTPEEAARRVRAAREALKR